MITLALANKGQSSEKLVVLVGLGCLSQKSSLWGSNSHFMRDANAKVEESNMSRVSMQKDGKILQKIELKTPEMQACNGWK